MLNILQSQMYAKMHFGCTKMHLMQKCCVFCFAKNKDATLTFCWFKNAFDAKMHFGCAKMHLMQKCIWCVHFVTQNVTNAFWRTFSKGKCSAYILRSKMFSITFSKGKCDAKMHFCKANQNVRKRQNAVFFALQKTKAVRCVALPKCILAYIWLCKMFSITFSKGKCSAQAPCVLRMMAIGHETLPR